ncbi:MAG: protein phosphatase 2C domain-containing protein [Pseudomonadota bacterium]
MYSSAKAPRIDVVTALDQGARDYQEDSLVADFPLGRDCGFAVLADGMGAHASGDLASSLVVGRVFSLLKANLALFEDKDANVPETLRRCVEHANHALEIHVTNKPSDRGMGATLVIVLILRGRLYWASVGDSPLYVLRNGELAQLNEDHSMAPSIDAMVAAGQMSANVAATHPDRNVLTSAISGDQIARVDCPDAHYDLKDGDTILLSSDGLQSLSDADILETLTAAGTWSSYETAAALLTSVTDLANPDQDNVSFMVAKYNAHAASDVGTHRSQHSAQEADVKSDDVEELEEASEALLEAMSL